LLFVQSRPALIDRLGELGGALDGVVDISLEMRHLERASGADRGRVLYGYSRHERTPLNHVIELTADGTDYCSRGALANVQYGAIWQRLRRLFAAAGTALSQREVAGQLAAAGETLWRWLSQAVARGLLLREGAGTKVSPYRYRLPDQDETRQAELLHESIGQDNAPALREDADTDFLRPGRA
jgi:hypothetical protein